MTLCQFLDNKYYMWYLRLTTHGQLRSIDPGQYYEKHHILPRSMGGGNEPTNLSTLTAREHFVCHWLLTKITTGRDKRKMVLALHAMTRASKTQKRKLVGGLQYARIREEVRKSQSGENNPRYGVKLSDDQIQRAVASRKKTMENRPYRHNDNARARISESKLGKSRPPHVREQLLKNLANCTHDHNKGRAWFNDGQRSYLSKECPPGCLPGRLPY